MAYETSLDHFIRDANLKLVRNRLAHEQDPAQRKILLEVIRALEAGEAIPASSLSARLAPPSRPKADGDR